MKQGVLIFLFLVGSFLPSVGQSNAIKTSTHRDSLLIGLDDADTDNTKLKYYYELAKLERTAVPPSPTYLIQGLELAQDINDFAFESKFLMTYGGYYINRKNYPEALIYYHKAIKVSEKHQINYSLIRSYYNVGVLYYRLGDIKKAEEYIFTALKTSEVSKDTSLILELYNAVGSIKNGLKDHVQAKLYMQKHLDLCIERGNENMLHLAYMNLGIIYKKLNQPDSSLYNFRKCLAIAVSKKDTSNLMDIYPHLLKHYMKHENKDSSAHYIDLSLNILQEFHPASWKISIYGNAFSYFKKIGYSDSAVYYIQQFYILKDSLFDKEQLSKINRLEKEFETEKYQVQIENLEYKNMLKTILLIVSIIGLVAFSLIVFFAYRSYKLRSNLYKQDQVLAEAKSDALKERVEFQRREIVTNALYITNQNKMFDDFLDDLKTIKKLPEEKYSNSYQKLILKLQNSKKNYEQKEFRIKFIESHSDFYNMMKENYPSLTNRDLDLCAYLKLNMSTKEIAGLSNQSVRAVEMARSRLRKKLKIDRSSNLVEYIQNI